jgi:uncharacterized protein involved in exopolysaccharide biosynthesis
MFLRKQLAPSLARLFQGNGNLKKSLWRGAAGALLVALLSLAAQNRYTSVSRLLPLSNASRGNAALGALQSLYGIGGLSGSLDGALPDIIQSRTLLEKALGTRYTFKVRSWRFGAEQERTQTLEAFLGAPDRDIALQNLQGCLEVAKDFRTGILTLRVTLPSADLAEQVNKTLTDGLDAFLKAQRQTRGQALAEYMRERIESDRQDLQKAVDAYLGFMNRNRGFSESLDPEVRATGQRLETEVDYRKQALLRLNAQVDQAILEEKDATPVVDLLEPASLPIEKSGPSRAKWVILAFLAAFMASMVFEVRDRIWSE